MIAVLTVFITQILFIGFRTINVRAVANHRIGLALLSGLAVGLSWMVTTAMAVYSIGDITTSLDGLQRGWPIIVAHMLGGQVGTYLGMILKKDVHRHKPTSPGS